MRSPLLLALLASAPLTAQAPPVADATLLLSAGELARRLADSSLVVIQVGRDIGSYAEGHVPGARFLPFRAIVVERDGIPNELPPVAQLDSALESVGVSTTSRIVIVGEPLLAGRLFFTLDYLGLGGQAALLDGGLAAWKAGGLPLTTDLPPARPGRLEPEVQGQLVVEAAELGRRLHDSSLALVDARPPAEWTGATPGDGVLRPGRVPGARSFFWRWSLNPGEPALLKEPAVLARLLGRAGVTPGRELVIYCRTGVQASHLYFVARYLGYHPRLYDGSFIEWSQMAELPVER